MKKTVKKRSRLKGQLYKMQTMQKVDLREFERSLHGMTQQPMLMELLVSSVMNLRH